MGELQRANRVLSLRSGKLPGWCKKFRGEAEKQTERKHSKVSAAVWGQRAAALLHFPPSRCFWYKPRSPWPPELCPALPFNALFITFLHSNKVDSTEAQLHSRSSPKYFHKASLFREGLGQTRTQLAEHCSVALSRMCCHVWDWEQILQNVSWLSGSSTGLAHSAPEGWICSPAGLGHLASQAMLVQALARSQKHLMQVPALCCADMCRASTFIPHRDLLCPAACSRLSHSEMLLPRRGRKTQPWDAPSQATGAESRRAGQGGDGCSTAAWSPEGTELEAPCSRVSGAGTNKNILEGRCLERKQSTYANLTPDQESSWVRRAKNKTYSPKTFTLPSEQQYIPCPLSKSAFFADFLNVTRQKIRIGFEDVLLTTFFKLQPVQLNYYCIFTVFYRNTLHNLSFSILSTNLWWVILSYHLFLNSVQLICTGAHMLLKQQAKSWRLQKMHPDTIRDDSMDWNSEVSNRESLEHILC